MKAVIYVEGPSDVRGLTALFRDLIAQKAEAGIAVNVFPARKGDAKKWLLLQAPVVAANTLLNDPGSVVAIVPDLTPPNKGFPHTTAEQMIAGIRERFEHVLRAKGSDDIRLRERFCVFCFKYEFEVLSLAAEAQVCALLGCDASACRWTRPPEDHDHGDPPKDVLMRLFRQYGRRYQPILSAVEILRHADYLQIKQSCPQHFAPFAEWIESL